MDFGALLQPFQAVGRDLYDAGLVSSHGGNLSARLEDEAMVITRHGAMLGHIAAADLVEVAEGRTPTGEPSLDTALHQAIYRACPEAGAVVHAHPRHAIALSLALKEIVPKDLEGRYYLKLVPVVPALSPEATRLGESVAEGAAEQLAEALQDHVIAVVAGHGSYARGADLWQALQWTSVLEESAQVLWLLRRVR